MTPDTLYVDIDGVIAGKNRQVNWWIERITKVLEWDGLYVVFVTDRPKSFYADTFAWLRRHMTNFEWELVMLRKPRDGDSETDLKLAWVKKYGIGKIFAAIEDNAMVAEVFAAAGIPVLQVRQPLKNRP